MRSEVGTLDREVKDSYNLTIEAVNNGKTVVSKYAGNLMLPVIQFNCFLKYVLSRIK